MGGNEITNEEKAKEIATNDDLYGNSDENSKVNECYIAALEMAELKDEQYLKTVQENAENYVKGVAKANPDLSACILNLLETAYIAGRNRIK